MTSSSNSELTVNLANSIDGVQREILIDADIMSRILPFDDLHRLLPWGWDNGHALAHLIGNTGSRSTAHYYVPAPRGSIKRLLSGVWRMSVWRRSVWRLSCMSRTSRVAYREQRGALLWLFCCFNCALEILLPRKTKIGTEDVALVTRDSDTTFKVKRSKVKVTRPLWLVVLAGQHGDQWWALFLQKKVVKLNYFFN